jgi:hypothetical protein
MENSLIIDSFQAAQQIAKKMARERGEQVKVTRNEIGQYVLFARVPIDIEHINELMLNSDSPEILIASLQRELSDAKMALAVSQRQNATLENDLLAAAAIRDSVEGSVHALVDWIELNTSTTLCSTCDHSGIKKVRCNDCRDGVIAHETSEFCPACGGDGSAGGRCWKCFGTGMSSKTQHAPCQKCEGRGYLQQPCVTCRGAGHIGNSDLAKCLFVAQDILKLMYSIDEPRTLSDEAEDPPF